MLLNASGGTGILSFSVDNIPTFSPHPAPAGVYNLTVTDANSCTASTLVIVNQPDALVLSATSTDASCNGANGSINFSATGGIAPVDFTVNSTIATSPMNVVAGTYQVIATDYYGCSVQTTLLVNEPSAIGLTVSTIDATCYGQNGELLISSSGGTGTIALTVNGSVASNSSSFPAGNYVVVATDVNGCSTSSNATIFEPSPLLISASSTDAACNGSNGSIIFGAIGGTGTITYQVNGTIATSPYSAAAGTYTVTATDANGCSATSVVNITEPSAISLTASASSALCNGANGSLQFNASGGTGTIVYTVNGTNANSPLSAIAGAYTIVATDVNGCSIQTTLSIIEPSALVMSATAINPLCNGNNGSLVFSANGGTGSIAYTVNNSNANSPLSATAGTYTVVATDVNGCSVLTILFITEPSVLNLTASSTNALCQGSNGAITFGAIGGTGSILYQVNGTNASSPFSAAAGTYTIVATDANGCSAQTNVAVTEPSALVLTASATNALCNGANGSINFVATGGTGTITYKVNGNNATTNMLAPVGNYIVTATDANGCSVVSSVSITAPSSVVLSASSSNAICNGGNGALVFNATGGTGTMAYTVNGNSQTSPLATTAGTYTIVATDVNGCTAQTVRTITQPSALVLSTSANHVLCAGGNGSLVFSATGGTGTKIYTVNGVVRNSPATVQAGTYTIAVTDANACVATSVVTVNTINALPTVSLGADVTICQGGSTNLSLSFTGNAPWTFSINGGAPQVTATNPRLISVSPVLSTQYIITSLSDATCSNPITDSIWVNTQPCGNLMPLITSALTHQVTYKTAASTYTVTATNTPTSYAATGLPSGLNFATATGIISGTATALPGVYPVQISAFNQYGSDTKTLFVTVNPRQLTITGVSALAKVYDGTTTANLTGIPSLVGKASGDIVNVGGTPTAEFNNRNAGNGKPVTCSGYVLTGAQAAYYTLTQPTLNASISKRSVTITGVTALSKVFDGNTSATISGTAVANNLVAGDSVSLSTGSATANFTSPTYGYNKVVIFSGYSLIGADAINYNLNQPSNALANIICAPVSVSNIVPSGNKATISWPAGSLQYVLEYRLANSNANWTVINTTQTSQTILGLMPSTLYEVRLKASCVAGMFSDYTNTIFSTTSGCSLPVLQLPVVNGNSATVSWTATADSIYQLNYRPLNAPNWITFPNTTIKNRTITGLTINTTYQYQVRSICKNGDVSVWVQGQFTTTSGCGLPTLNSPIVYGNSAKVSWNGSSDSTYQVSYKTLNSNTWIGPFTNAPLNRTITGLSINTTYQYQIRSICKNGDMSAPVMGQFTTTSGCGLALINNVSPITGNSATINYSGTSDSIYQVSVRVSGATTWPVASSTPNLWFKANGLLTSTTYQYQIRSVCKNGDASAWVQGQFTTTSGCGLPVINAPLQINGNSALVTWSGSSDSVYQVSFRQSPSGAWSAPTLTSGAFTHQLAGLSINTTYDYRIRSICKNGDISNWVSASLTTNSGCPTVTLNAPVVTSNSATISWNNVLAIGYIAEFYYTPFQIWVNLGNLPTTSRFIGGLQPNTTYPYRVRSSCSNADMSAYTYGSFTTVSAKENNSASASLVNVNGALNEDGDAVITWNTISEWQVKSFEIEHRIGNNPFMPLATVPSQAIDGNSEMMLNYQSLHTNAPYGLNQYRLWVLGIDGSRFLHNDIISLRKSPFETTVQVYPNPATTDIYIQVNTDRVNTLDIKLMDATGRTVKAVSAMVESGLNNIPIDISSLPTAMYTISIYQNGQLVHSDRFQKAH
ncbi:MAG: T9SS type A sorting domain-containing protein [Chitinophagaceae bacterium]|nr:T9SS type A sorting domain-containing protein [Chitinophagaceae bacterium]